MVLLTTRLWLAQRAVAATLSPSKESGQWGRTRTRRPNPPSQGLRRIGAHQDSDANSKGHVGHPYPQVAVLLLLLSLPLSLRLSLFLRQMGENRSRSDRGRADALGLARHAPSCCQHAAKRLNDYLSVLFNDK